jgi:hypothetical protein
VCDDYLLANKSNLRIKKILDSRSVNEKECLALFAICKHARFTHQLPRNNEPLNCSKSFK